jgi:hypothetical protein
MITPRKTPLWWVKCTHYEYWPWLLLYAPMLLWWLRNAWRTGSLSYFTAINPGWVAGGFYGVSKKSILDRVPPQYKPATCLVTRPHLPYERVAQWTYPLIAKPDVGERGKGVTKIDSLADLRAYHATAEQAYIVQEYVDYPLELAILYSRLPTERIGVVSSITLKEFLSVTGDGVHTLRQLVQQQVRARFQEKRLAATYADRWECVLPRGQKLELESIGNHSRGTRFVNANYLINKELCRTFDHIADQIEGFQYGRFDLRVASIDDLYAGQNIRVVELNGVNADPAHIYDNSHGLYRTYRDLIWHWNRIGRIAQLNRRMGVGAAGAVATFKNFSTRNL